jgi:hypothetical protein
MNLLPPFKWIGWVQTRSKRTGGDCATAGPARAVAVSSVSVAIEKRGSAVIATATLPCDR